MKISRFVKAILWNLNWRTQDLKCQRDLNLIGIVWTHQKVGDLEPRVVNFRTKVFWICLTIRLNQTSWVNNQHALIRTLRTTKINGKEEFRVKATWNPL